MYLDPTFSNQHVMDTEGSAKHTILIVFPVMNGMRGSHPTLYGVPLMWLCGWKNHNGYTGFCKVHYLNLATRKQCCLSRGCDSIQTNPLWQHCSWACVSVTSFWNWKVRSAPAAEPAIQHKGATHLPSPYSPHRISRAGAHPSLSIADVFECVFSCDIGTPNATHNSLKPVWFLLWRHLSVHPPARGGHIWIFSDM